MKQIRIADFIKTENDFFTLPFEDSNLCKNSGGVRWGMTLLKSGSMRFRWNETNPNREQIFEKIKPSEKHQVIPVQLDHTKIVYDVSCMKDTFEKIGDGIITKNSLLVPAITIADCMPVYLYDPVTEVFGIVHSGWKGTGIAGEAINLAKKNYGSNPKDFRVVLGPHIHDCCYIVNRERAEYFEKNFSSDCIEALQIENISENIEDNKKLPAFVWDNGNGPLFRLSLEKANLSVLEKTGVSDEHITICKDCTACTPKKIFGSNRRESSENGKDNFTVMAGFVFKSNL